MSVAIIDSQTAWVVDALCDPKNIVVIDLITNLQYIFAGLFIFYVHFLHFTSVKETEENVEYFIPLGFSVLQISIT